MNKAAAPQRVTRRGLTIVAIVALFVAALGLGTAEGGGFLSKGKAKKVYLSKKSAGKSYLKKPTKLQVPASTAQLFPPQSTYQDTNAAAAGAHHDAVNFGHIGWSWILPPWYPAGKTENVKIYFTVNATGCNLRFEPNSLSINKIGSSVNASQNDIGNPGGTTVSAPSTGNQVGSVTWTIPGTVQGTTIGPGTSVLMGTFRNPSDIADTCNADMVLKGMEVSW